MLALRTARQWYHYIQRLPSFLRPYICTGVVQRPIVASRTMASPQTFASGVSDDLLEKLYSTPTSTGAPGLSGPTHESTRAVLEVLRHDLKRHAPFVNRLRFHKYEKCCRKIPCPC